jgi:ribosomal protein S30
MRINMGIVIKRYSATAVKGVIPNIPKIMPGSPVMSQTPRIPAPAREKAMGIPRRRLINMKPKGNINIRFIKEAASLISSFYLA